MATQAKAPPQELSDEEFAKLMPVDPPSELSDEEFAKLSPYGTPEGEAMAKNAALMRDLAAKRAAEPQGIRRRIADAILQDPTETLKSVDQERDFVRATYDQSPLLMQAGLRAVEGLNAVPNMVRRYILGDPLGADLINLSQDQTELAIQEHGGDRPWLGSAANSLTQLVASGGTMWPATLGFGLTASDQALTRAKAAGLDDAQAARYALEQGAAEAGIAAAFNLIPGAAGLEGVFGKRAAGGALKGALKSTAGEVVEEGLTTVAQSASDQRAGTNPNALDPENLAASLGDTVGATLATMGLAEGARGTVRAVGSRLAPTPTEQPTQAITTPQSFAARLVDLHEKKQGEGLTPQESAEYDALVKQTPAFEKELIQIVAARQAEQAVEVPAPVEAEPMGTPGTSTAPAPVSLPDLVLARRQAVDNLILAKAMLQTGEGTASDVLAAEAALTQAHENLQAAVIAQPVDRTPRSNRPTGFMPDEEAAARLEATGIDTAPEEATVPPSAPPLARPGSRPLAQVAAAEAPPRQTPREKRLAAIKAQRAGNPTPLANIARTEDVRAFMDAVPDPEPEPTGPTIPQRQRGATKNNQDARRASVDLEGMDPLARVVEHIKNTLVPPTVDEVRELVGNPELPREAAKSIVDQAYDTLGWAVDTAQPNGSPQPPPNRGGGRPFPEGPPISNRRTPGAVPQGDVLATPPYPLTELALAEQQQAEASRLTDARDRMIESSRRKQDAWERYVVTGASKADAFHAAEAQLEADTAAYEQVLSEQPPREASPQASPEIRPQTRPLARLSQTERDVARGTVEPVTLRQQKRNRMLERKAAQKDGVKPGEMLPELDIYGNPILDENSDEPPAAPPPPTPEPPHAPTPREAKLAKAKSARTPAPVPSVDTANLTAEQVFNMDHATLRKTAQALGLSPTGTYGELSERVMNAVEPPVETDTDVEETPVQGQNIPAEPEVPATGNVARSATVSPKNGPNTARNQEKPDTTREALANEMFDQYQQRSPHPKIVPKYEIEGNDGKWYSGDLPPRVQATGERRLKGYVFQNKDGVRYGPKAFETEAEAAQWLSDNDARNRREFMDAVLTENEDRWNARVQSFNEETKRRKEIDTTLSAPRQTKKQTAKTVKLGTGSEEDDARLAALRKKKANGRGMTAGEERSLQLNEERAKADPSKWNVGDGVGWRVDRQVNRGYRIESIDPETKTAVVRPVADTGLTVTGGGMEGIGPETVHIADLVRDNKYSATPREQKLKKVRAKKQASVAAVAEEPVIHETKAEAKKVVATAKAKPGDPKPNTTLKEQKQYLAEQIDVAIANAPDRADLTEEQGKALQAFDETQNSTVPEHTRSAAWDNDNLPKVTIKVPGDGTFTIVNTKQALEQFKTDYLKRFPVGALPKYGPSKPGKSAEKKPPTLGDMGPSNVLKAAKAFVADDPRRPSFWYVWSNGNQVWAIDGRRAIVVDNAELGGTLAKPVSYVPGATKPTAAKDDAPTPPGPGVIAPLVKASKPLWTGVNTSELYRDMKQAATVTTDNFNSVYVYRNPDGTIGYWVGTPEVGEFIKNVQDGATKIAILNPDYVADIATSLRQLGVEKVDIWVDRNDSTRKPVLFRAEGVDSIVMPINPESMNDTPSIIPATKPSKPDLDNPEAGAGLNIPAEIVNRFLDWRKNRRAKVERAAFLTSGNAWFGEKKVFIVDAWNAWNNLYSGDTMPLNKFKDMLSDMLTKGEIALNRIDMPEIFTTPGKENYVGRQKVEDSTFRHMNTEFGFINLFDTLAGVAGKKNLTFEEAENARDTVRSYYVDSMKEPEPKPRVRRGADPNHPQAGVALNPFNRQIDTEAHAEAASRLSSGNLTDEKGARGLANPFTDEQLRKVYETIQVIMDEHGIPSVKSTQETFDRAAKLDPADIKRRLLKAAQDGTSLDNEDEIAAAILLVRDEMPRLLDEGKFDEAARLVTAFNDSGTTDARKLAIRRQQHDMGTPEGRRQALIQLIGEPSTRLKDKKARIVEQLNNTKDPAKQQSLKQQLHQTTKELAGQIKDRWKILEAEGITKANLGDAKPSAVRRAIKKWQTKHSTWNDAVYEFWVSSILAGPQTQVVNITSTAMYMGHDLTVKRFMRAMVNLAYREPGAPTVADAMRVWRGFLPGMKAGMHNAWAFALSEEQQLEKQVGADPQSWLDARTHAIGGKRGRVVRSSLTMLGMADEFLKTTFAHMEVHAQAAAAARRIGYTGAQADAFVAMELANKKSNSWAIAVERAVDTAFQTPLTGVPAMGQRFIRKVPGGRWVFPFMKTAWNLVGKGVLEFTPAGLPRLMHNIATSKLSKEEQVTKISEQLLASAMTLGVYAMLGGGDDDDPWITGSMPRNKQKRELYYRLGLNPYTIKLPSGQRVSYARLEPFATGLALLVDGANIAMDGGDNAAGQMWESFTRILGDKLMLRSMQGFFDSYQDAEKTEDFLENFVVGMVPNSYKQIVKSQDPFLRETQDAGGSRKWERRLYRAFPHTNIPKPRYDIYGDPIEKGGTETTRLWSPVQLPPKPKRNLKFKVDRVIKAWNEGRPEDTQWWPGAVPTYYTKDGKTEYWTDAQYEQLQIRAGRYALEALADVPLAPDNDTMGAIEQAFKDARAQAKRDVLDSE